MKPVLQVILYGLDSLAPDARSVRIALHHTDRISQIHTKYQKWYQGPHACGGMAPTSPARSVCPACKFCFVFCFGQASASRVGRRVADRAHQALLQMHHHCLPAGYNPPFPRHQLFVVVLASHSELEEKPYLLFDFEVRLPSRTQQAQANPCCPRERCGVSHGAAVRTEARHVNRALTSR